MPDLQAIQPISLADISQFTWEKRVDHKFILTNDEMEYFINKTAPDFEVLEIDNRRKFKYSSHYFDNDKFLCYEEHLRKKRNRFKIRTRSYLDSNLTFLEVKQKYKRGITFKKRIQIDTDRINLIDYESFLENDCALPIQSEQWNLVYSCFFNRMSFLDRMNSERITIDCDLNLTEYNQSFNILELKQERNNRCSTSFSILRSMNCRPKSFSKYCFGLWNHNQRLRYGRFKKDWKELLN